jgi:hypothetical protein
MTTRTTTSTVTFRRSFTLGGFEDVQAAGCYIVETEEELIQALSFPAWKRISTVMHVHRKGRIEYLPVDPAKLGEALLRDSAQQGQSPSP